MTAAWPEVTRFDNGYEASVIPQPHGHDGLLEVAAFIGSSGTASSVKGWLTREEADAEVARIGTLPQLGDAD